MPSKKYKVGYTTGVFDMFHIGHLNILRRAKEQCEYLIVGVSTDELVEEYKNKTPIIPYENRKEIVESIKHVDKVVPQNTMDKIKAWEEIHFDAMFHGSDWKNSELYIKYQKEFEKIGVELVFLPHTDGVSSTELIKKLKKEKEQ